MNFWPKVSIVIPVYNGTNFLAEAVRSALAQSYDNLEIVIVNDGSTDEGKTAELGRQFQQDHPRLVRYFEKVNGGVASALNLGIRELSGEYFSWLSHDDLYHPDKIRAQVESLTAIPAELRAKTLVYSDFNVVGVSGEIIGSVRLRDRHSETQLARNLYPLLNGLIHGCSLLIPVHALRELGGFDETLRYTQDYDLWLRLFQKVTVSHVPELLISSRQHAEQDSLRVAIKDRRQEEEDALWIKMFNAVSPGMRREFEGSEDAFFRKLLRVVEPSRMPGAHRHILLNWMTGLSARDVESVGKVAVVIPSSASGGKVESSLQSIRKQTYEDIEILALEEDEGFASALRAAILNSSAGYIAFISPGDVFHPRKIAAHLQFAGESGSRFAQSSYISEDKFISVAQSNGPLQEASASWSTYFIERDLLLEFLSRHFTDLRTLFWRIGRVERVGYLDLPLANLESRNWEAPVDWRDLSWSERVFFVQLNVAGLYRGVLSRIRRSLKNGIFDHMPIRVQGEIRRLLAR